MIGRIIKQLKEASESIDEIIKVSASRMRYSELNRAQDARRAVQEAITVLLESDKEGQ